jgi:hypothetical protein
MVFGSSGQSKSAWRIIFLRVQTIDMVSSPILLETNLLTIQTVGTGGQVCKLSSATLTMSSCRRHGHRWQDGPEFVVFHVESMLLVHVSHRLRSDYTGFPKVASLWSTFTGFWSHNSPWRPSATGPYRTVQDPR